MATYWRWFHIGIVFGVGYYLGTSAATALLDLASQGIALWQH